MFKIFKQTKLFRKNATFFTKSCETNRRMNFSVFAVAFSIALSTLFFACSDEGSTAPKIQPAVGELSFSGCEIDSVNETESVIYIKAKKGFIGDSLVLDSVEALGGATLYLAANNDLVDPELGDIFESGVVLTVADTNSFSFVVLDEAQRIVRVWLVVWEVPEKPTPDSSSSLPSLSSSSELPEISSSGSSDSKGNSSETESSSSILEPESSSSSNKETENSSSSSSEKIESSSSVFSSSSQVESSSSSDKSESSSSNVQSSSSNQESSSSSEAIQSAERAILDIQVTVNGVTVKEIEASSLDITNKVIALNLQNKNDLNAVQIKRLDVSENATTSAVLKTNLSFSANGEFYETTFSVTAQNGESDIWTIRATVPKGILLSDLSVTNGTVSVSGTKIYVEVPYGTNLSSIQLNPLDSTNDLRRPVSMEFVDGAGALNTYSVVAGVQLPGSDFSQRVDSFWGTTSDAMATKATNTAITMSSSANAEFNNSQLVLTSRIIGGKSLGITAAKKLAGGFYFTGTFSGTDCNSLYNADGGYPGLEDSDFSGQMTVGQAFNARPTAFEVAYSYSHEANENSSYPQKSLIYVILVSADNKAVATGVLTNEASVSSTTQMVTLSYGADPNGMLSGGYAGTSDLTLGTGTEEVTSIRVMFASSAYAYVAENGSSNYRGGENASLTIDNFKLVY